MGGLKKYGVRTIKLAEFARTLGFTAETLSLNKKLSDSITQTKKPNSKDILKYLKRGIPVVLNVRYYLLHNNKPTKEGHFIVISGYEKNHFWYNDPEDAKKHKIEKNRLKLAWISNANDSSAYLLAIWM